MISMEFFFNLIAALMELEIPTDIHTKLHSLLIFKTHLMNQILTFKNRNLTKTTINKQQRAGNQLKIF